MIELGPAVGQVASLVARVAMDALAAVLRAELAPLEAKIDEQSKIIAALESEKAPRFGTVADAARILSCSTQTVRSHIAQGRIVATRIGSRGLRVDLASLRPVAAEVVAAEARAARGGA
jgi:excisionase family DNA binding protein